MTSLYLERLSHLHAPKLVEAVQEIAQDPKGHSLWWVHPGYGLSEAHAFIARADIQAEHRQGDVFAIMEDGVLLGLANAKAYDWVHHCCQGGYWLRPSARGRGAATEALRQLALERHKAGMLRMELLIGHANVRSQSVAKRVGAQYEGRLRGRLIINDVRSDAALLAIWLPDLVSE